MTDDAPADPQLLRLLLVEDLESDEELVLQTLRRAGYEPRWKRVETSEAFKAALGVATWDVIISDNSLPRYSGLEALADLKSTSLDIPFILVSGTIGESLAVRAMKAGAQDYVLKADLTRLPGAVEREVREAGHRTEETMLRQQLVISDRMATAGTLAAGVAHEINNPLALVMTNVDYLAGELERIVHEGSVSGEPGSDELLRSVRALDEPLREAREGLERIRDIVRDVKLFSRPDDEVLGALDVHPVIESSIRMAQNEIRHRAKLMRDFGQPPPVKVNDSRLGQVVLNLIVNAAQAIPEGHTDDNEIRVATSLGAGGRAVIEVRDTGCGIPSENLRLIFQPFFTTKPIGVGTGLGLAICHRIVTEMGGAIEVESEVGRGSTFRVSLPPATPGVARERPTSMRPPSTARARVLVVDDEEALARSLARALASRHDVVALTSAKDAIARVAKGERFDVIISDLMMPDVTGMDLHEKLRQVAPDQADRMVFISGGAFTARAREFLSRVDNPRMEKPCDLPRLLAVIAETASRAEL